MSAVQIYLDESGDLGWTFTAPYRHGGSSRFLTIGALIVPKDKGHLPKRFIKDLYKSRGWTAAEKKWSDMGPGAREEYAEKAADLIKKDTDVFYCTTTVKKERVADHIRNDPNKLYNWTIKFMLLDKMSTYDEVQLIPDPRSIKVESGKSLHDYLQTELWLEKRVKTVLKTTPLDSSKCLGLQFTDMLSGLVQSHFEDADSNPWKTLHSHITAKTLFF